MTWQAFSIPRRNTEGELIVGFFLEMIHQAQRSPNGPFLVVFIREMSPKIAEQVRFRIVLENLLRKFPSLSKGNFVAAFASSRCQPQPVSL